MTTTEGNRLIAEFEGWKSHEYDNLPNKLHKDNKGRDIDQFNYHEDWSKLMPVVEKIQSENAFEFAIEFGTEANLKGIVEKFYRAGFYRQNIAMCRPSRWEKSQIVAVWEVIVRFIQWYNQQK